MMITISYRGEHLICKVNNSPNNEILLKRLRKKIPLQLVNSNELVLYPKDLPTLVALLEDMELHYKLAFTLDFSLNTRFETDLELRDYQKDALEAWEQVQRRGIFLLPTGSGKTVIGIKAIEKLQQKTIIFVPTLALLDQWASKLNEFAKNNNDDLIGKFGGGKKEIKDITICTYDSGALYIASLSRHFGLVIFDEVHHLTASNYQIIAYGLIAPFRLGLTATIDENIAQSKILEDLVGEVCYRLRPHELREKGFISPYKVVQIPIQLSEEEKSRYDKKIKIFREYIRKHRIGSDAYQKILYRVNIDPQAKAAIRAFQEAQHIAYHSPTKFKVIQELLEKHPTEQILIFGQKVNVIEKLSRHFLIPCVTYKTASKERRWILDMFKQGKIRVLAVSQVFDEGIDVPTASVGIILSGSGVSRQFIQRLGRILRPHPTKDLAILYELVTQETTEVRISKKRKKMLKGR